MKIFHTAIIAGMALALTISSAHADSISDYVHLELGAGVSWYQTLSDGVWYQQGMQHSLGLSAPVLMGGFTGPLWKRESWGIDWHADYVSLGHVSSQCECTPDDANYSTQTHSLVANQNPVPNANFVGNGNAQGIELTLEPYVLYRGWRFGLEGGIFPYRPSWDETIYGWQGDMSVAPKTLTAHTPRSIQLGEVVGLNVGRGPLTVALQHYFLPTRFDAQHSPAIWSGATVLMVKYRF
ncbi:hypothetical protein FHX57_006729 [Paraburkholderia tropica]|uniref:hypothetical protein n=1 Tax=Paraburkholderia tropica TaxID=92647 RepID=UPI001611E9EE|nr:hypothetical protein [Paraburkholderia tropica]MBB3004347.1 hypothetical protein [Paraburkholderia tropica]